MTANQIAYWTLQETKRSNLERERQGRDSIAENIRHNKEGESIGWSNYGESIRHNKMMEDLNRYATDKDYESSWNHDTVSLVQNATKAAGDANSWVGAAVGGLSLIDRMMANAGYTGFGNASTQKTVGTGSKRKYTVSTSVTPKDMKGR